MHKLATDWLVGFFAASCLLSIYCSSALIVSIETLARKLGLNEVTLGLIAALCADTPEITSAFTAHASTHSNIGVGIVVGSNLFNIATLLGLGAIIARKIKLERDVIANEGLFALVVAALSFLFVARLIPGPATLVISVLAFILYIAVTTNKLKESWLSKLPLSISKYLRASSQHEKMELKPAIDDLSNKTIRPLWGVISLVGVILASVVMESSASTFGSRFGISPLIVGAIFLAAITSMPNLVAAIFLARRGRSSALLSEALNSNSINLLAGLFIPGLIFGIGKLDQSSSFIVVANLVITFGLLMYCYIRRGLTATSGIAIIALYLALILLSIQI